MGKKILIIFPFAAVIILAFYLYKTSLSQSVYLGLPTVPCFDTTKSIKQNYSVTIIIKINGQNEPLEATIGHDYGKCLHTIYVNDSSGKVFIKANDTEKYNLGQFFDVWHKSFSNTQLGECITTYTKPISVIVDGNPILGKNLRNISLVPNEVISISCGE